MALEVTGDGPLEFVATLNTDDLVTGSRNVEAQLQALVKAIETFGASGNTQLDALKGKYLELSDQIKSYREQLNNTTDPELTKSLNASLAESKVKLNDIIQQIKECCTS